MKKEKKKFRLYPEHKTLYYEIEIYSTRKQMLAEIKLENPQSFIEEDTRAYTSCFDMIKFIRDFGRDKAIKTPKLGKVYLTKEDFGVNTISHEMLHATSGYFARRGYLELCLSTSKASDFEERFAYCLGAMVGDFFYKIGWR